MHTKHQIHVQEKTLASLIALSVFALAILFVSFILPAVPGLMEKSYQQGIPMNEFLVFKDINALR
jgi:cytochrome c oxidase assembly factor CtaG